MPRSIYKRLKDHPGVWRVDGIGELSDRRHLGAAAIVHFSQIDESQIHDAYRRPALTNQTISLVFNIASLYEFKVGSLWKNGALFSIAPPQAPSFRIDVSRSQFHKLGKAALLNGRWAESIIPESQYRFGENRKRLAESRYVAIPVLDDSHTQWLIVPCSELVRFYFGASSRLLSSVIRGTTDDYVLWQKSRIEGDSYILHIKQNLSRKEAAVLTRTLTSNSARTALFGTHNNLSNTKVNNQVCSSTDAQPLMIYSNFPFDDETRLTVAGKRIRLTQPDEEYKSGQWAVFAMQILTCSHSFGFTNPIIESDEPFPNTGKSQLDKEVLPTHYPFLPEDEEEELEVHETPADARLRKMVRIDYSNQFSGLDGVRFQHLRPNGGEISLKGNGIPLHVEGFSLGEKSNAENAKSILGIGIFQNHSEHIDLGLSLFVRTLEFLNLRIKPPPLSWQLQTRSLENRLNVGSECVTTFPMHLGKRRTWHKIQGADVALRPRQVVIAQLEIKANKFFYLLEMELKPSELGQCTILLHALDFSFIEDKEFNSLLKLTAIQNRWIDESNKWPSPTDEKSAAAFFSKHTVHRIRHHQHLSKHKVSSELPKLIPRNWAKALLKDIEKYFVPQ